MKWEDVRGDGDGLGAVRGTSWFCSFQRFSFSLSPLELNCQDICRFCFLSLINRFPPKQGYLVLSGLELVLREVH